MPNHWKFLSPSRPSHLSCPVGTPFCAVHWIDALVSRRFEAIQERLLRRVRELTTPPWECRRWFVWFSRRFRPRQLSSFVGHARTDQCRGRWWNHKWLCTRSGSAADSRRIPAQFFVPCEKMELRQKLTIMEAEKWNGIKIQIRLRENNTAANNAQYGK